MEMPACKSWSGKKPLLEITLFESRYKHFTLVFPWAMKALTHFLLDSKCMLLLQDFVKDERIHFLYLQLTG